MQVFFWFLFLTLWYLHIFYFYDRLGYIFYNFLLYSMSPMRREFIYEIWPIFRESLQSLFPVVLIIGLFQLLVFQSIPDNIIWIILWVVVVWLGLSTFLVGLKYGIFPMGAGLTDEFIKRKQYKLILIFGFLIWFAATITEPTLFIIAQKASIASEWRIDETILRYVVALAVWVWVFIWLWRIIKGIPLRYVFLVTHSLLVIVTAFTPREMVGLSYDLWWASVSTITVPLLAAIGMALSMNIKWRSPVVDWFGLIAIASVISMFFVKVYGIIVFNFLPAPESTATVLHVASTTMSYTIDTLLLWLMRTIRDILPIIVIIFVFQFIVLKKKTSLKELIVNILWIWWAIFWLYAFLVGLDIWLLSLWDQMAEAFSLRWDTFLIYLFAFCIGFGTSIAEPGVLTVVKKVSELSEWRINALVMRILIALGVGIGLLLASYRLIHGLDIGSIFIVGYITVVWLTLLIPKHIIALAFDSGTITTSTITVPIIASLALGLATNMSPGDAMIEGFGMIGFACLFPIIMVMIYTVIVESWHNKKSPIV